MVWADRRGREGLGVLRLGLGCREQQSHDSWLKTGDLVVEGVGSTQGAGGRRLARGREPFVGREQQTWGLSEAV